MGKKLGPLLVKVFAATFILFGALLSSLGIVLLDFSLAHILNDWSGIAPVGHFYELPYRFAISSVAASLVSLVALFLRYPPMVKSSNQAIFGALCGLATVGSLLGHWISDTDIFFSLCALGALGSAFYYRATVIRDGATGIN